MYVCVPVCLLLVVRLDWACLRTCLLDHLQNKICNQNGQTKIALLSSWDFLFCAHAYAQLRDSVCPRVTHMYWCASE